MTDSLKLAEMQRTSIEFERQRHLASWFIKSSPHMATPPPPPPPTSTPTSAAARTATTSATTALGSNGGLHHGHGAEATNCAGVTTVHSNHAISAAAKSQQQQQSSAKLGGASGSGRGASDSPLFFNYIMSNSGNKHSGSACAVVTSTGGAGPATASVTPLGGGNCNMSRSAQVYTSAQLLSAHHHPNSSGASPLAVAAGTAHQHSHHLHVEGRKPKLRRFNSHDANSNMFSVADFENARLARRNEIELKQRLQRRMRISASGGYAGGAGGGGAGGSGNAGSGAINGSCGSMVGDYSTGDSKASKYSHDSQHEPLSADVFLDRYSLPRVVRISYKTKFSDETLQSSSSNGSSTVTSSSSASGTAGGGGPGTVTGGNSTSTGIGTDMGTGTGTSSSTASSSGNLNNAGNHNTSSSSGASSSKHAAGANGSADLVDQEQGELFLLYRLIRQRHIYHGYNAKTGAASRKKGVLIPQEFSGYFSLVNEKGLPTATLYTSLIQLVRERVYKFISVDNMPAFTESQTNSGGGANSANDGCLPVYTSASAAAASAASAAASNRPSYVKTTARGGQVFRLLAVFEDGKQDHNAIGGSGIGGAASGGGGGGGGGVLNGKSGGGHGREKEKGRYAQVLNENRQVMYVSLSTKGKFYEIEPGVPQILQKLGGMSNDPNKRVNPDCVHRVTALVTPNKELPLTLRYISGPGGCANAIPDQLCITKISTESVAIACPIEDVEVQSPLHLRKLHLTKEMGLLKSSLGFESEQRMLANPNVQNILKFCQFNCDQFLKMVEVEVLNRAERSASKSRVDGLKILKPLHLPKLLRREKTTISAHEKEDSIIFLTKSDLANLEAKEAAANTGRHDNSAAAAATAATHRISDKMKVFQTTKKKWFRKQDKHAAAGAAAATAASMGALDLDVQAKRLSMERYSDMSKLLQERFGDKSNSQGNSLENETISISEPSGASDIGCSDTETTTLATIDEKLKLPKFSSKMGGKHGGERGLMQKSMSLQDIELIGGGCARRKPDLLAQHTTADTISEAGTDLEDLENQAPPQQSSFITEKLYTEFHVKTRQYSKSSSSLHQLLNFSMPQKLHVHAHDAATKRTLAQLKQNGGGGGRDKRPEFSIGEPVTGRRAAGGLTLLAVGSSANSAHSQNTSSLLSPLTPTTSLIEDDLPYSSVRDSLVLSSDESAGDTAGGGGGAGNICQALHLIDYTKENIYAEICHDANGAIGSMPPHSHTRDTISGNTHSTQISSSSDDYGGYASLTYPGQANGSDGGGGAPSTASTSGHQAVSRVQINCSSSPISYHTVYMGEEPLGPRHAAERRRAGRAGNESRDRSHITTVSLEGAAVGAAQLAGVDNIYNTLK